MLELAESWRRWRDTPLDASQYIRVSETPNIIYGELGRQNNGFHYHILYTFYAESDSVNN